VRIIFSRLERKYVTETAAVSPAASM